MWLHTSWTSAFLFCAQFRGSCVLGKCRVGKAKVMIWDCSSGRTSNASQWIRKHLLSDAVVCNASHVKVGRLHTACSECFLSRERLCSGNSLQGRGVDSAAVDEGVYSGSFQKCISLWF
jgi:hypothetical protein